VSDRPSERERSGIDKKVRDKRGQGEGKRKAGITGWGRNILVLKKKYR